MEEEKLLRFLKHLSSITVFVLISNSIAFSALKITNFKKSGSNISSDHYAQKNDFGNDAKNSYEDRAFDNHKLPFHLQLNQDRRWIDDLSWQAKDITVQNILEKIKELSKAEDLPPADKFSIDELKSPKVSLRIFVSSSMPVSLLKSYYKEAQKFGGILVFNGLPNGSFIKLTKLVMDIAEDDDAAQASMQIDDSAFSKYNIKSVPTIVLSKEKDCWLGDCSEASGSGYNNDQSNSNDHKSDQMSGNVSISYALSQFALLGELRKEANRLLK